MSNVDFDIEMTGKLMNGISHPNYNKIYFSSNEDLKTIFSNFDFNNKNVLTVLGSGDQAFHFYNKGANQVDLFDINKLTIYYYYLRKWVINYYGTYYPNVLVNNNYFIELFSSVKPCCDLESDALIYWKKYFIEYDYGYCLEMFSFSNSLVEENNKIEDLSVVKEKLNNSLSNIYNTDISKENIIKKHYDVIYTSNISEWLYSNEGIFVPYNESSFVTYRDNLYDLLNNNGIVIMSNYGKYGATYPELRIFKEKFEYMELPVTKIVPRYYEESPGYVYTKK